MRRARLVGIVVILLILAIGPTQALALLPGIGVKAGVNAANVDLDNTSNKTGFVGGAFADVPMLPLRVELLYSQEGFTDGTINDVTDWETSYTFIDVPVMFILKIPLVAVTPFGYVGLNAGFLTDAKSKSNGTTDSSGTNNNWVDIKAANPDIVWSVPIGVGIGFGSFHADLRYTYGLTSMTDPTQQNISYKERTWSLMLGWALF